MSANSGRGRVTGCSVAGAKAPRQELHGVDLSGLFVDPEAGLPQRNLYWYLPGYSSFHEPSVMVRRGKWKLIRSLESESVQLYDTVADIGKTIDLRREKPSLTDSLNQAALQWLDALDAPRMVPNPAYKVENR